MILVVSIALLLINVHLCGLDANVHVLRMRNVTHPTGYQGFVAADTPAQF